MLRAVGGFGAVRCGDPYRFGTDHPRVPFYVGNPVFLKLVPDSVPELPDRVVLIGEEFFQIKTALFKLQAKLPAVVHDAIQARCVDERFGGDTAAVDAGPAQLAFFNNSGFHAKFCSVLGSRITARSGADDDEVKQFIHSRTLPASCRRNLKQGRTLPATF